jgi:hypothetical protein
VEPEALRFVPRTLPPAQPDRISRAQRERQARAYWDSLTPQQESWVLKKMRFAEFGSVSPWAGPSTATSRHEVYAFIQRSAVRGRPVPTSKP